MAIGTDYNVKQDLIAAVVAKVFKNDTFGITGEGLQKALCDMIESLWGDEVGTGTGAPNYVDLTHAQLNVLIAGSLLAPGTWYRFTYENVHAVTDTLLTNTTAPGYTQITETFLVLATGINKLSGFALSEENPYDVIEYNPTQASHGTPAVLDNGSIIRRYDILNDNEAYFDFRNHTVARFPLDLTTILSPTTVGRSKIYKDVSNNNIGISVRDDASPTNFRLVDDISDIAESQPYYTLNSGSIELFTNNLTLSTTPVYFPSFHTSGTIHTGIKLGKSVSNVLISNGGGFFSSGHGCTNVKIENGSSGITIISSTNINIGEESTNILVKSSDDINLGKKGSKVLIFQSQKAETGTSCSEILLVESNNTEIKNTSNDILILRSNYTEIGTKNSSIFVIRESHKNVFGNSCGAISLGSTTANDFKSSCTDIDIYSGGYNRFAQGCNVINLVGEQDNAFTGGNYYSPYSEMSHNTFGIACSNISFGGTTGGRGNMFGDECGNLVFGGLSSNSPYGVDPGTGVEIPGPALMNTSFCRGIRNKSFQDYPLTGFSIVTPDVVSRTNIDYTRWYSQVIVVRDRNLSEGGTNEFYIEIKDTSVGNGILYSITFKDWEGISSGGITQTISYTSPATGTVTKATITAGFLALLNSNLADDAIGTTNAQAQGVGIIIPLKPAGNKYYISEASNNLLTFAQAEGLQTKSNIWHANADSQSSLPFDVQIGYEGAGIFDGGGHIPPNGLKGTAISGPSDLSRGYDIDLYPTGGAYMWTRDGYPLSLSMSGQINKSGSDPTADFIVSGSPRTAPLP